MYQTRGADWRLSEIDRFNGGLQYGRPRYPYANTFGDK